MIRYRVCLRALSFDRAIGIYCNALVLFSLACLRGFAYADDYVLDPSPTATLGSYEQPYEAARDPQVCALYLKNLRYFAQRALPLSCGQPIAPTLKNKIQNVEWEDLDPDQYPGLFKAVVGEFHLEAIEHKEPSEDELAWDRDMIRKKIYIFRRAKLQLEGYPAVRGQTGKPPKARFQIVQYDANITDPNNPDPLSRCEPKRGRMTRNAQTNRTTFYLATEDLSRLYRPLTGLGHGAELTLWLINKRLYTETYDLDGDVQLSEVHVDFPVESEPVCLYHYTTSRRNEE